MTLCALILRLWHWMGTSHHRRQAMLLAALLALFISTAVASSIQGDEDFYNDAPSCPFKHFLTKDLCESVYDEPNNERLCQKCGSDEALSAAEAAFCQNAESRAARLAHAFFDDEQKVNECVHEMKPADRSDPSFYETLKAQCLAYPKEDGTPWVKLTADNFAQGTYRITRGGCYYLAEDVEFDATPDCCDYWPRMSTSNEKEYPMGVFSHGFFAAITVEADDVWLDFNNYTLIMSPVMALKQRFFSIVQLSSRVFEAHDGQTSLNIQDNDLLGVQGKEPSYQFFEGVDSLNDDAGQEVAESSLTFSDACKLLPSTCTSGYRQPANRPPNRVVVRNGGIGRSSHFGIQGNGAPSHIVIEDLKIFDWEVAGISLNGAKHLTIRRCDIGPAGRTPVNPLFASVRFMSFWFGFYWKLLWVTKEIDVLLIDNPIHFADSATRPGAPSTVFEVFRRMVLAENLLVKNLTDDRRLPVEEFPEGSLWTLEDPISQVFTEAERLWAAAEGSPDAIRRDEIIEEAKEAWSSSKDDIGEGGSIYGIKLHRRRQGVHKLGSEDWNFYGPDEDSTSHVRIYDVKIHDIVHATKQIPTLVHDKGGPLVGPTGESVRITEYIDPKSSFGLATKSQYKGNLYTDSLLAFYKVSNGIDETREPFLDSEGRNVSFKDLIYNDSVVCGNNFLSRMQSRPDPEFVDCRHYQGAPSSPAGPRARDPFLQIQKRFFGNIFFSKEFFDWATLGEAAYPNGLQDLLVPRDDLTDRRRGYHKIACGGDTQHHTAKGAFGMRIEFADDVMIENVEIDNIANHGDKNDDWCERKWHFKEGGSAGPSDARPYSGADVHGMAIVKSFGVYLTDVSIDNLYSEEGSVMGLDLLNTESGNAMYPRTLVPDIHTNNVRIGSHLVGGEPGVVRNVLTDNQYINFGALKANYDSKVQNNWRAFKSSATLLRHYSVASGALVVPADMQLDLESHGVHGLLGYAKDYIKTQFGLEPSDGDFHLLKEGGEGQMQLLCIEKETCVGPWPSSTVTNVFYSVKITGPFGRGTYDNFLGQQTLAKKVVPPDPVLAPEFWPFTVAGDGANYEVRVGVFLVDGMLTGEEAFHYFSATPEPLVEGTSSGPIQKGHSYDLFNEDLGFGGAHGVDWYTTDTETNTTTVTGFTQLTFDDIWPRLLPGDVLGPEDGPSSSRSYDVVADGKMREFVPALPDSAVFTAHFYLFNEAGVKDMHRYLGLNGSEIRAFRRQAIQTLNAFAGIFSETLDPTTGLVDEDLLQAAYPVAVNINNSFGGLVPYTSNHNTELRLHSSVDSGGAHRHSNVRVTEVGFLFRRPPPLSALGPILKVGSYIFEDCVDDKGRACDPGTKVVIDFEPLAASLGVNEVRHTYVQEKATLRCGNCSGIFQAIYAAVPENQNHEDVYFNFHGTFKFPDCSAMCMAAPTPAPTPYPTAHPTGSPTAHPTPAPTGAPTEVCSPCPCGQVNLGASACKPQVSMRLHLAKRYVRAGGSVKLKVQLKNWGTTGSIPASQIRLHFKLATGLSIGGQAGAFYLPVTSAISSRMTHHATFTVAVAGGLPMGSALAVEVWASYRDTTSLPWPRSTLIRVTI